MNIVFVTIYNTVLAVGIILIGAYISDVSATVTHRKLVDENKTLNNLAEECLWNELRTARTINLWSFVSVILMISKK